MAALKRSRIRFFAVQPFLSWVKKPVWNFLPYQEFFSNRNFKNGVLGFTRLQQRPTQSELSTTSIDSSRNKKMAFNSTCPSVLRKSCLRSDRSTSVSLRFSSVSGEIGRNKKASPEKDLCSQAALRPLLPLQARIWLGEASGSRNLRSNKLKKKQLLRFDATCTNTDVDVEDAFAQVGCSSSPSSYFVQQEFKALKHTRVSTNGKSIKIDNRLTQALNWATGLGLGVWGERQGWRWGCWLASFKDADVNVDIGLIVWLTNVSPS